MAYDAAPGPDPARVHDAGRAASDGSAGSRPVPLEKGPTPAHGQRPGAGERHAATPVAEQPTLAAQPLPGGSGSHNTSTRVPPVPRAPGPPPGVGGSVPSAAPDPYGQPAAPYPAQGPYPGPYAQPAQYAQPGYGYQPGPGWAPPSPPTSGICTAAMVVGVIAGVMTVSVYGLILSWVLGPIALGLGISARRKVARGEAHGSGSATAGFVLGIVTTAISWLLLVLAIIGLAAE